MITEKDEIYTTKIYITSDGKKYYSWKEAQKHEDSLKPPRDIPSHYCYLNSDDRETIVYKISSKEDLEYLRTVVWKYNALIEQDGFGWYIAFTNPGGDYEDDYDVMPLHKYLAAIQEDINDLKKIYEE